MNVGSARFGPAGGIHEVPLPGSLPGRLLLCGLGVVGPDPEAALIDVDARLMVCLLQPTDIELWYPAYADWLAGAVPDRALHLPTRDFATTDDELVVAAVDEVVEVLSAEGGVLVHCGAGIGRAGSFAVAAALALGAELEDALTTVRSARPGAGPQSDSQLAQLERLAGR